MAKNDIVGHNASLYPPIKACITAIHEMVELAPVTLRSAIKMAAAHEILNLDNTDEAREILASVYSCYTLDKNTKEDK